MRNDRHHLSAMFGARGVHLRSGHASLGLSLRGYGHGRVVRAVEPVAPVARANRVDYPRGAIDEWYANGPLGVEQGFTLAGRVPGRQDGPLTLSLALSGNMRGALSGGSDAVTLAGAGVSLAYRGLVANDASGRQLPARIELRGDHLLLRIDDRGARYPLRIDPFVQLAKLTASDGGAFDSHFGFNVAIFGNTVVAGAEQATVNGNSEQGEAYVFVKPASGWANATETAKLTASDGAANDNFGQSVAIDGNTVVVGAFFDDVNGVHTAGAAYVFTKPAGGWVSETEAAKLTASDGADNDRLGTSVGISGNTVVAGSVNATVNGHSAQGAVYVFVEPTAGWASETETAKLTASDGDAGDILGRSVGISANTVVAGSLSTVSGHNGQGAAYVFLKPAGDWTSGTEAAKLTASDGAADDILGNAVAISGDTVVAAAEFATVHGHSTEGAVYVFVKPAGGWVSGTETAKLTISDGEEFSGLGQSVAIDGNTVVAGAVGATVNGHTFQGAAYVFAKPAGGWVSETETAKLTASDGATEDNFGISTSVSANTVVVGSVATVNGHKDQGAGYVFADLNPTKTSVTCSPSTVVAGNATTCTATVTDTAGSPTTPSGTVSFSSSPGPGGFTGSPCTLSGSGASASCSVTYTPSATTSNPVRTDTITATYGGDDTHSGGSGTIDETVISPTALARGAFVIGNKNVAVGNAVTFWGAQWMSVSSMSGGAAPAAFKGFASNIPNNPPKCGDPLDERPRQQLGPAHDRARLHGGDRIKLDHQIGVDDFRGCAKGGGHQDQSRLRP